ncbi:glycosyltransferase involved in cell wall biosynthesis [Novosphingobium sp. 1529]|uniref:glycosyltransferase n=1 Tax=Novosphingobium sp. 1529 TaxID=3156424 RepID=UPI00339B81C3
MTDTQTLAHALPAPSFPAPALATASALALSPALGQESGVMQGGNDGARISPGDDDHSDAAADAAAAPCVNRGDSAALLAADLAAHAAEAAAWRAAAQHARLAAAQQAERHERALASYETRVAALEDSPAYRLGDALLQRWRKPQRWLGMPAALLALRRPATRPSPAIPALPEATPAQDDALPQVSPPAALPPLPRLSPTALSRAEAQAARKAQQHERRARIARADAHAARARALRQSDPVAAAQAAQEAHAADPQPWRAKWLAFRLYDAGELTRPAALLAGLPADTALSGSESSRAQQIQALAAMAQALPDLPPVAAPAYDPRPQSLLYCAASALPWHTSGYTTRTQALLRALLAQGVDLVALTRAGYPWDRADSSGTPEAMASSHEGLDWQHLRQPSQSLPLDIYIERASVGIARLAKARRVAAIHAASNHVNALPALIAARRLGIPFHYELRGLWEMSRAANVPGFAGSQRHALGLELEAFVARHADRLFAISAALADHVIGQWGLDPARLALLPNGIDAPAFAGIAAARHATTTIGYAGALVAYEGLDLLLDALAMLHAQGLAIDLVIMGDGPLRDSLEAQAARLGLAQAVTFTGRLEPDAARARMAACHIACLPRRRSAVTELVPPIKLVEAMALGLPAVVPDLPVFRAEAQEGETALFFTPGDAADLARAIAALARAPAMAHRIGQAARDHATAHRDWASIAQVIAQTLREPEPAPAPLPEPALPATTDGDAARHAAEQALAQAATWTREARALAATNLPAAIALAEQAQAIDPQPWRAKWLGLRLDEAGETARAIDLLQSLPTDLPLSRSEARRIQQILHPPAPEPAPDPAELAAAQAARERAHAQALARTLTEQAMQLQGRDPLAAARLGEQAYAIDPQPWRAKWLGLRLHEAGETARAIGLLQALPADLPLSRSEARRIQQILHPPAPEPAPDPAELAAAQAARERAQAQALARTLTEEARQIQDSDPLAAARLGERAYAADPQPWRAKWLAFRLYDAGELTRPAALLAGLPADTALSGSESSRAQQIQALAAMAQALPDLPPVAAPAYDPRPQSLLYCAASALPWHTSGYTTRTQALLRALLAQGVDLVALTRAGYPWDRADSAGTPEALASSHEGLEWQHLRQPSQSLPLDIYIERASIGIARLAKARRVAAIHAASNHVNALPALIAARRLGIPFHYELRGLWEMSRAANVPGFAGTERHALGLDLEALVARQADRVFTISAPLADHVIGQWGLDPARLALLPNGIDAPAFATIAAAPLATTTIGYAGALVAYEGLDLLLDALAMLHAQGLRIDLVIMGDGPLRESLEEQAARLGLAQAVSFTGRLEPDAARARMAACHIACLPRRRSAVTELIPPIKLVEAMALGLPAVVPDLPVFRAEAQEGETALFFNPGDAADLARAIAALANDPALGRRIGQAARDHVTAHRDWNTIAQAITQTLPSRDIDAQDEAADLAEASDSGWIVADAPKLIAALGNDDLASVSAAMAATAFADAAQAAREWLRLGKAAGEAGQLAAECRAAQEAVALDRGLGTLTGAYAAAQRAGAFDHCARWMLEMRHHPDVRANPAAQARIERLGQGLAGQLDLLALIAPRGPRLLAPVPGRICYMLHNSLPYATGGYATRTHGLAGGLIAAGCDVVAMTRPGFPHDALPDLADSAVPEADVIDGVPYLRTPTPARTDLRYVHYIPAAARALEERYRALRPALVMAASNHLVALPALIAARRLGIPFAYEVRGFWEVTKMSREESYRATPAYQVQERLEAAIAQAADQVFTLTEPMAEELAARGVAPGRIALLPNSCDPARFAPRPRDAALARQLGIPADVPVIGYIGTFVDYEGLDDLAAACALLKAQGCAFRLLLVGSENTSSTMDGPIGAAIAAMAENSGFADWLIMPGRVPHEAVESWYSLIDICPFPRKPWPVCEMVSPMKPLEALAMEKAVVVSDVRALAEMIADGHTGLAFAKGDVPALTETLARLIADPALRAWLGRRGRAWVAAERTWRGVGESAARLLHPLLALDHTPLMLEAAQ